MVSDEQLRELRGKIDALESAARDEAILPSVDATERKLACVRDLDAAYRALLDEVERLRGIVRDLAAFDSASVISYEIPDGDGFWDEMEKRGPCVFCRYEPDAKLSRDGLETIEHSAKCLKRRAVEAVRGG